MSFRSGESAADVVELLRPDCRPARPDLFAGRKSEEVNGEINVREFLGASMDVLEGEFTPPAPQAAQHPGRAVRWTARDDIVRPEGRPLMAQGLGRTRFRTAARMTSSNSSTGVLHFTHGSSPARHGPDDRLALSASFAGPIAAGYSSAYLNDRDQLVEKASGPQAQVRVRQRFFEPSLAGTANSERGSTRASSPRRTYPTSLLKMVARRTRAEW